MNHFISILFIIFALGLFSCQDDLPVPTTSTPVIDDPIILASSSGFDGDSIGIYHNKYINLVIDYHTVHGNWPTYFERLDTVNDYFSTVYGFTVDTLDQSVFDEMDSLVTNFTLSQLMDTLKARTDSFAFSTNENALIKRLHSIYYPSISTTEVSDSLTAIRSDFNSTFWTGFDGRAIDAMLDISEKSLELWTSSAYNEVTSSLGRIPIWLRDIIGWMVGYYYAMQSFCDAECSYYQAQTNCPDCLSLPGEERPEQYFEAAERQAADKAMEWSSRAAWPEE